MSKPANNRITIYAIISYGIDSSVSILDAYCRREDAELSAVQYREEGFTNVEVHRIHALKTKKGYNTNNAHNNTKH